MIRTLYHFLHDLSGNVKLALALGAPVVIVVMLDWRTRRQPRAGK